MTVEKRNAWRVYSAAVSNIVHLHLFAKLVPCSVMNATNAFADMKELTNAKVQVVLTMFVENVKKNAVNAMECIVMIS